MNAWQIRDDEEEPVAREPAVNAFGQRRETPDQIVSRVVDETAKKIEEIFRRRPTQTQRGN